MVHPEKETNWDLIFTLIAVFMATTLIVYGVLKGSGGFDSDFIKFMLNYIVEGPPKWQ